MELYVIQMSSSIATAKPSTKKIVWNSESAKTPSDPGLGRGDSVINWAELGNPGIPFNMVH